MVSIDQGQGGSHAQPCTAVQPIKAATANEVSVNEGARNTTTDAVACGSPA